MIRKKVTSCKRFDKKKQLIRNLIQNRPLKNESFFFLCTVRRMSDQFFFQHYRKNQFEQRLFHLTIVKSKHKQAQSMALVAEKPAMKSAV